MKKVLKQICIVMVFALCIGLCAGCSKKEEKKATYTITVMNNETEVGKITATEGTVLDATEVQKYENLENYKFNGWYGTPTFMKASALDLTTATFTEDTTIFGDYVSTLFTADTHNYYIVGESKKKGVLNDSAWAGTLTDEQKAGFQLMRTAEDKNEFAITMDLYEGDSFQIILDWAWDNQHGFGYVTDPDPTFINVSEGGGLSSDEKKMNVGIIQDGNYTVTIATDPENTEHDAITIVRNGDATVALEAVAEEVVEATPAPEAPTALTGEDINVRVKGSWVADWSDVKKLENVEGTSDWTITMELAADTELCFAGYNGDTDSGIIMKEPNVTDDASKAFITSTDGNNIKIAQAGTYTFTVNADDLSVKIANN